MSRARGFIDYKPTAQSEVLLTQVKAVVENYRQYLPMTIRQLFYQLVVGHAYDKTEKAYKRLCELLGKFRRGGLIEMNCFRDDGFTLKSPWWFDGHVDFAKYVDQLAKAYTGDRQAGQGRRILIWSEAAGLVPQIQTIVRDLGIQVCSSGGFDSLTVKHQMGELFASVPTIVLHCGDFDPSGVHVYSSLSEDVIAFAEAYDGDTEFRRVAVHEEHIDKFDLPTSPPKATDVRSFDGNRTVQLEALSPPDLESIILAEANGLIDQEVYQEAIEKESEDRSLILEWVQDLKGDQ